MEPKGEKFARVVVKSETDRYSHLDWVHIEVGGVLLAAGTRGTHEFMANQINAAAEKWRDEAVRAREKELLDTLRNYFVRASWCRTEDYIQHPIGHAITLLEAIKENQDGAVKEAESRVWGEAALLAVEIGDSKCRCAADDHQTNCPFMVGKEIASALRSKAASS